MRSTLEAICVLLWPSAILMLGAQTYHGGTRIVSAIGVSQCGVFRAGSYVAGDGHPRFNFAASALKPSDRTGQLSGGRYQKICAESRPIA